MSDNEETERPPTLWSLVEQSYRDYYPGLIVQGFMILDVDDGDGRTLRFTASQDATSWAIKGMLHEVSAQLDAEGIAELLMMAHDDLEDEDEDE